MQGIISTEIYWLTATVLMTALFWVPVIVNRIIEIGAWATLKPPQLNPKALWAERLRLAHANAIENLAIFAPLVLIVHFAGISTSMTAIVCLIYFIARLIHVLAYVAAIPVIRTLAFVGGFICQMALAITVLSAV
jgi:uncharacterized MAPEG superfamily protein